ncbi:hypothetical protein KCP73_03520 [Salmonella enterica subsp. enterica]|nr:hypothetical protein KCP73_03520 [Salmonella enterica subsp. enterica]
MDLAVGHVIGDGKTGGQIRRVHIYNTRRGCRQWRLNNGQRAEAKPAVNPLITTSRRVRRRSPAYWADASKPIAS